MLPDHVRLINVQPLLTGGPDEHLITLKFKNLSDDQSFSIRSLFSTEEVLQIRTDDAILVTCPQTRLKELLRSFTAAESLPPVIAELRQVYETAFRVEPFRWQFRGGTLSLTGPARIMGVVNVTPDSFSDGGEYLDRKRAIEHALDLVEAGADLIDIGGESTRPGSQPVSLQEEIDRVLPVIEGIRRESSVPISIDTYKSRVARLALEAGANVVNDISGGQFDPEILAVVREFQAGIVLMHIKGTPRTMQQNPTYKDVVEEVMAFLSRAADAALQAGIEASRIVLDPGIGFGKRWFDNYDLLNRLQEFRILGFPLLIGASRKSFLGKILAVEPREREEATVVANARAIWNGAQIIRVHDVAAARQTTKIAEVFHLRMNGVAAEQIEDMFHA